MGVLHNSSTYGLIISPDGVSSPGNNIEIVTNGSVHNLHSLLNAPMTRDRPLQRLFGYSPQFREDIYDIPGNAVIGDFGCGDGFAMVDLIKLFPGYRVIAVDQQEPSEIIQKSHFVRYVQRDLESGVTWQRLLDNSFDYIYSFFTSMYVQDPFSLLQAIQKKLNRTGNALIHLGYVEQYTGGIESIKKRLPLLDPTKIQLGNALPSPLLYKNDKENTPFVGNAYANIRPIYIRFGKEDDLSTIQPLQSTKGFFVDYENDVYQLSNSDKWYTYATQDKTKK